MGAVGYICLEFRILLIRDLEVRVQIVYKTVIIFSRKFWVILPREMYVMTTGAKDRVLGNTNH